MTLVLVLTVVGQASRPGVAAAADPPKTTKNDITKWMTELSNWGRWGKTDQIGTLNLITPEKRKAAMKLARDGVSVSLAHTLDKEQFPDNPRPLGQQMTIDNTGHAMDLYTIWYHGSTITHIDSLCHYSFEGKDLQRLPAVGHRARSGLSDERGRESESRHHDARRHRRSAAAEERSLPRTRHAGVSVGSRGVGKSAGIKIGPGDAVFLRTGRWVQRAQKGPWNVAANSAGWHASVMPWLKQRDVALLGNDAVNDVQPSGVEGNGRPIHQLAIVAMGLPLVDVNEERRFNAEPAKPAE